jgi:hypothetical protein
VHGNHTLSIEDVLTEQKGIVWLIRSKDALSGGENENAKIREGLINSRLSEDLYF